MFALVSGRLVRDGCTLNGLGGHGRWGICSSSSLPSLSLSFLLLLLYAFLSCPIWPCPGRVVLVWWWWPRGAIAFLCLSLPRLAPPAALPALLRVVLAMWPCGCDRRGFVVVGGALRPGVRRRRSPAHVPPWFRPCHLSSLRPRSVPSHT